jgi:hypothetical protein
MSNEYDDNHQLTDADRARVVRGIYTSTLTIRDEDGGEVPMLEIDAFLANGDTVQMWIPPPLLTGLITASSVTLACYFPPQTVTEASFDDETLERMAGEFAAEFQDTDEDPFPDRKHDDDNNTE